MKKLLIVLALFIVLSSVVAVAVEPAQINFEPDTSGKFIYCNNREFIFKSDLADTSNRSPRFIMSNHDMEAGKYAMFLSHVNRTEVKNAGGWLITEPGFDVELDVLFRAKEDTTIRLTAMGFEVPENSEYYLNGETYTQESEWGCFAAWASYLGVTVSQQDSGQKYSPVPFEPVEFQVKAGEEVWLSSYIPNYREVPYCRPVHLMADFEVVSGKTDINVAALRSTGMIGDRSRFNKSASFGSYIFERQHKGIADSLNKVDANLNFSIDDSIANGDSLPVMVYNQLAPEGNTVWTWYTNLNPRSDIWNKNNVAESGMLSFKYYDPSKLGRYGDNVPEEERDPYWYFDTKHSDRTTWPGRDSGYLKFDFVPGYELKEGDKEDYAASLGNFGVLQNYHISVTNNGYMDRYINYNLNTSSNNLIILKDENGEIMEPYPIVKGTVGVKERDTLASVRLPAQKTTKFTLTVVLTTNHVGGMENNLTITDNARPVSAYTTQCEYNVRDNNYTGREYIKWLDGELMCSYDGLDWTPAPMNKETKELFEGKWGEFEFVWTGDGYLAKSGIYDGTPYYTVQEFYKTVYLLDKNFNLIASKNFGYYPDDMSAGGGMYYVSAGTKYYSKDGANWELFDSQYQLPSVNYSGYYTAMKKGKLHISVDGVNFLPVWFDKFKPSYIDSLGDVYYFIDNNTIYLSMKGTYWTQVKCDEKISSIGRVGGSLLINHKTLISIPSLSNAPAVLADNKYYGGDAVMVDGSLYLPLRQAMQFLSADAVWQDNTAYVTIGDSTAVFSDTDGKYIGGSLYVPLRVVTDKLNMNITYNGEKDLAIVE
ncbi:MAG: hypothetical protein PHE51_01410 [Eubacteriales bacterium]|nr:hypothetical protein [Eubacteriales bacterium]